MVRLYDKEYSRDDVRRYWGGVHPGMGIRRLRYEEGKAKDMSVIELKSGSGLRLLALPDRALDIGLCEYKGRPLSYVSPIGESSPEFFEARGEEWLRNFAGGLLVTCGLSYLGGPCVDEGQELNLHGRISNLPASEISIEEQWQDDQCILKAKGKVREAKALSTNLVLEREIRVKAGENSFSIKDTVRNEGFASTPHMILYHINLGHPLLAEGSELIASTKEVIPRDEVAEARIDDYNYYKGPERGYPDTVFYHQLKADNDGWCQTALVNKDLGLGLSVCYQQQNLPNFIQWKYTNEGYYATGLEPANCHVDGRDEERKRGTLTYLEPGAEKEYNLEIGILDSNKEIDLFAQKCKQILSE